MSRKAATGIMKRTPWQPFGNAKSGILTAAILLGTFLGATYLFTGDPSGPGQAVARQPNCNSQLLAFAVPGLIKAVDNITMLSNERRANVIDLAMKVMDEGLEGDLLEAGVWQGGASILMKAVLAGYCSLKHIYACDSYQGLPTFTSQDKALPEEKLKPMDPQGSYAFTGGVEAVQANFAKFGLLDNRVHFVVGYFNETLPQLTQVKRLALLRMDGDMYSSTMDILENMYDRLVPGGYCIIDDYGYWPQCRAAVQDFFKRRGDSHVLATLTKIDDTGVWFRKPHMKR